MRTIYVYCKKCNVQVAGPLVEIPEESLRLGDRQDALEVGQFSLFTDMPVSPQMIISLKEGELWQTILTRKDFRDVAEVTEPMDGIRCAVTVTK